MSATRKTGYSLNCIDDDEWSWSVERLRDGETTWGVGSGVLADGCERSRGEAITAIRAALAAAGVAPENATALPM